MIFYKKYSLEINIINKFAYVVKLINNASFINYAFNQLSKDPIMESLINSLGHKINPTERYNRNYALAICNLIIEQQISFKAAITIKN